LAPSNKNLIVQLYNRGIIDHPKITFLAQPDEKRLHPAVILGNFNSNFCEDWIYLNSSSKNSWRLRPNSITFGILEFENEGVSYWIFLDFY
jgi:hypothetical protein